MPILIHDEVPLSRYLSPRPEDCHKGHFGKLLILAGCELYSGAARLCAGAALRLGAGLVTVAVPQTIWNVTAAFDPGYITQALPDRNGELAFAALDPLLKLASVCDAMVIGPGLGHSDDIERLLRALLDEVRVPLVIDADGLFSASWYIYNCTSRTAPCILTPHEGEFARLGGDLSKGRETGARAMAAETGCIVHLKGAQSLTIQPDGTCWVNPTGHPALARGGSGDILAGMTGAMLARMSAQARRKGTALSCTEAAGSVAAAAHLLGTAARLTAEAIGSEGLTAVDLLNHIPEAIQTSLT